MHHSRMRPLICVGLAYFVIAVVTPYFFLGEMGENSSYLSSWNILGSGRWCVWRDRRTWALSWAFNFGGKPVYVMPLVFGGAPVVNTLWRQGNVNSWFLAGLILVIAGAVMVLVLAPRGEKVIGAPVPVPATE